MKTSIILILTIAIAILVLCVWSMTQNKVSLEGFNDNSTKARYANLRSKITKVLSPYCNVATFAQGQMKQMYMLGNGRTEAQALEDIKTAYRDVYACRDEMAKSRPSCAGFLKGKSMDFVSCDTYLNLPEWSDDNQDMIADALNKIPGDLAVRVTMELEWYTAIIKKLNDVIQMGNNPPSTVPANPGASEGFANPTCSPAATQARRALLKRQQIEGEATSCTPPSADAEVTRVSALLDSKDLITALASSNSIMTQMVKLKSDQEKAKNGTLFPWQQDGPTKTYKTFEGGDRTKRLIFSMQQT